MKLNFLGNLCVYCIMKFLLFQTFENPLDEQEKALNQVLYIFIPVILSVPFLKTFQVRPENFILFHSLILLQMCLIRTITNQS